MWASPGLSSTPDPTVQESGSLTAVVTAGSSPFPSIWLLRCWLSKRVNMCKALSEQGSSCTVGGGSLGGLLWGHTDAMVPPWKLD